MKKLIFGLLVLVLGYACTDKIDDTDANKPITGNFALKESVSVLNYVRVGETKTVGVETDIANDLWTAWHQNEQDQWVVIDVDKEKKQVTIKANENTDNKVRSATVVLGVKESDKQVKLTVNQLGEDAAILVNITETKKVSKTGETLKIEVTTNVEYSSEIVYEDGHDWITHIAPRSMDTYNHSYIVAKNDGATSTTRFAKLVYKSKGLSMELITNISLYQVGYDDQEQLPLAKDFLYRAVSGRVSNNDFHAGSGIDKSYDGNYSTMFRSTWDVNGGTKFPLTLEYDLPSEAAHIDYVLYHSANSNNKGAIIDVEVFYNTISDNTFKSLGEYTLPGSAGVHRILFESPVIDGKTVKFVVSKGAGNAVDCKEMEFVRYNTTDDQLLLKVFKTSACMELADGVSREDINRLPGAMQDIAYGLMTGSYNDEFRMAVYRPYSDPIAWADKMKSMKLGLADNPTGIYVDANETARVFVGPMHGHHVTIYCLDASKGQNSGKHYTIHEGVNEIKFIEGGLLYIYYYLSDLKSPNAKPIEIHFPTGSGKVNGYFDIARDRTDTKYVERLSKASYKMFDIKGERVMFTINTHRLPANYVVTALSYYDSMSKWNWELLGVEKLYPKEFNVRHYLITMDGTKNPNATHYATRYPLTHFPNVLEEFVMKSEPEYMWGTTHEIGHQLQGVFNYRSFGESSNNLFSNMFRWKSQWGFQTRGMGLNSVIKRVFNHTIPFSQQKDDLKLRLYWQLYMYYDVCGKNPQFWPTLCELLRNSPTGTAQEYSMTIYKLACDAAREDLTEFFEIWGLLYPTGTHSDENYLTDQMIANAIGYVKSKSYPKAAPIQYIEDRKPVGENKDSIGTAGYYTLYRDNIKVSASISYRRSGDVITVTGGENAVAYELIDNNKVKFIAVEHQFEIPSSLMTQSAVLHAVQSDGTRIQIAFK